MIIMYFFKFYVNVESYEEVLFNVLNENKVKV